MRWSFSVLRLFGIELRVHATFVLLLVWIGVSHASTEGWTGAVGGLLSVLLIFSCVILHELGHAFAAKRFGIRTPDITLLPIGGVAHLEKIPERPGEELAVAIAGPLVSGFLALLFWVTSGFSGLEADVTGGTFFEAILPRLTAINLGLLLFNLLPAFPMDGGRILRAALAYRMGRTRATQMAARIGQGLSLLLAAAGFLIPAPILVLISIFVFMSARNEASAAELRSASRGLSVGDVMITQFSSLNSEMTLGHAVALLQHSAQHDLPIVSSQGRVLGLLTRRSLLEGLQEEGADAPVARYATGDVLSVRPCDPLTAAFQAMQSAQLSALPVVEDSGHIVGLLSLEKIGESLLLANARHTRI